MQCTVMLGQVSGRPRSVGQALIRISCRLPSVPLECQLVSARFVLQWQFEVEEVEGMKREKEGESQSCETYVVPCLSFCVPFFRPLS